MRSQVVVVGGAIAGAAVANALGSRGVDVLIVEKVAREVHSTRGDLLHPPTLRLLDSWGVLDALHEDGALPITELAVSHATRGLIARYSIDPDGSGTASRTIAVPHDRLEAVLLSCALRWPSVEILRGAVTDLAIDGGRVVGVRIRRHDGSEEVAAASVVVGCDGARSTVRRHLGIPVDEAPYDHEQVIISGTGTTELPAALHWYVDDIGALCLVSRPNNAFRILLTFRLGQRGDLLKRPDPALHDYVVGRFPQLNDLSFTKRDAHLYRLSRHVADRFWQPGVALVGDSAHATHPAGATGMSLAITGAARLASALAPALLSGEHADAIDAALQAYSDERQPAAAIAVASNHTQALRLWQSDLYRDPDGYARAVDPNSAWGARGAGWGRDPAALAAVAARDAPPSGTTSS